MKIVAIIPARGGSKRVKGKNVVDVCGDPLIARTIKQLKKWGKAGQIYVNSDSAEILSIAEDYGAEPYQRPDELAKDNAKVIDVVKAQILDVGFEDNVDVLIMLPTCPLRSVGDIEAAYDQFVVNNRAAQIVSVAEYEKAPEQALVIQDGVLVRQFPDGYSSRSQDHGMSYRYNTAIIVTNVKLFLDQDDIVGEGSIPYVMPYERSIDIDYPYQMDLVKLICSSEAEDDDK